MGDSCFGCLYNIAWSKSDKTWWGNGDVQTVGGFREYQHNSKNPINFLQFLFNSGFKRVGKKINITSQAEMNLYLMMKHQFSTPMIYCYDLLWFSLSNNSKCQREKKIDLLTLKYEEVNATLGKKHNLGLQGIFIIYVSNILNY